jgi:hypothetical protein
MGIRTIVTLALLLGITAEWLSGLNLGAMPWVFAFLLGVGLITGTFGINVKEMNRQDWKLLAWAVTVGVLSKALIIGGIYFMLTGNLIGWVVGMSMAQMDPLSTTALLEGSNLSVRARNLLSGWAAGDDPFTVAAVVAMALVQRLFEVNFGIPLSNLDVHDIGGFTAYSVQNFALMATIVFLFQRAYRGTMTARIVLVLGFMAAAVVIGATWYWMFGIALVGLFMRPTDEHVYNKVLGILEKCSNAAFTVAAIIIGALIWLHGVNLWLGIAVGTAAYLSQMIVTPPLAYGRGLPREDRQRLGRAHQNGLTASLLGLSTGTITVILPAIVTTHVLHFLFNRELDWRLRRQSKA